MKSPPEAATSSLGDSTTTSVAYAGRHNTHAVEVVSAAAAKVAAAFEGTSRCSSSSCDYSSSSSNSSNSSSEGTPTTTGEQWSFGVSSESTPVTTLALLEPTRTSEFTTSSYLALDGDVEQVEFRFCSNLSNITIYNFNPLLYPGSIMFNVSDCGMESTEQTFLPPDMTFDEDNLMSVIIYCLLFLVAAIGNLTVFLTLFRNRHRKSRVNLFIMHLSLADLIVTFIMLPLETIWHITVAWKAGDVACRLLMFFRAFGLYLSSFILVVISLDRYFAILHPLSMSDAEKRGKLMLIMAWLFSVIASLPQSVIFHVEYHPHYPWFAQCVTFNFFPTPTHELAYNLFNIITVYGLPLVIIVISYTIILCEMTRKTREGKEDSRLSNGRLKHRGRERLRRSGVGKIERARERTLKMTIMIVFVFILCWTPYFVMSAWWWFDKNSAEKIDPKVQRGLFMFAVSNSCMDPLVYGLFSLDFKREFRRCCCCLKARARQEEVTSQVLRGFSLHRTQTSSIRSSASTFSPISKRKVAYTACRRDPIDGRRMTTAKCSHLVPGNRLTPQYTSPRHGTRNGNGSTTVIANDCDQLLTRGSRSSSQCTLDI